MIIRFIAVPVLIVGLAALVPEWVVGQGNEAPAAVVARYRAARAATMEEHASAATVAALLELLSDSAVYEHPQARAQVVGRESIGEGVRQFLGATRHPRIEVLREIVTGSAVAAEERVTFEAQRDGAWTSMSRTQLTVYFVHGGRIARELQYWAPR